MTNVKSVFGEYAFRKLYEVNGTKYPINKCLFEVWSVSVTRFSMDEILNSKDQIVDRFVEVMNLDTDFNKAISQGTGSIQNVYKRFDTVEALLNEVKAR
jgi:hypothetical protein